MSTTGDESDKHHFAPNQPRLNDSKCWKKIEDEEGEEKRGGDS